jgi:hypothetical protein
MNGWVEPPPRKSMGCFGKGCLILVVFGILLGIACAIGAYWGYRNYSAVPHSFSWLTKINAIAPTSASIPTHETSDEKSQAVVARWRDFQSAVEEGDKTAIDLTADDLNDLIAAGRDTRDKMFVSINGNQLRAQTSIPLGQITGRPGYFFNSDIGVATNGKQSLTSPRLDGVTINGKRLPADVIDWTFGGRRLRDYIAGNGSPWNTVTVDVRDGKVILQNERE